MRYTQNKSTVGQVHQPLPGSEIKYGKYHHHLIKAARGRIQILQLICQCSSTEKSKHFQNSNYKKYYFQKHFCGQNGDNEKFERQHFLTTVVFKAKFD